MSFYFISYLKFQYVIIYLKNSLYKLLLIKISEIEIEVINASIYR